MVAQMLFLGGFAPNWKREGEAPEVAHTRMEHMTPVAAGTDSRGRQQHHTVGADTADLRRSSSHRLAART